MFIILTLACLFLPLFPKLVDSSLQISLRTVHPGNLSSQVFWLESYSFNYNTH